MVGARYNGFMGKYCITLEAPSIKDIVPLYDSYKWDVAFMYRVVPYGKIVCFDSKKAAKEYIKNVLPSKNVVVCEGYQIKVVHAEPVLLWFAEEVLRRK